MPRFWDPERPWYKQRLLAYLAVPALLLVVVLVGVAVYVFSAVPLPDDVVPQATTVLDRGGREVGSLSPVAAQREVALDELPPHVPEAVMAAEDRDFYGHSGVSVRSTLRALFTNVRAGEIEQGGSTITQQYIKNAALSHERTFTRKLKEAVLALKLEQQRSKDEILTFYLNTIYWGRGAYGIEAAARTYFNRPAAKLDVNQAATLAGMIRAPERLDPLDDPASVRIRRDFALDGMVRQGWLSAAEAQRVEDQPLPDVTSRQSADFGTGAYYLDVVKRTLADELGGENAVFRGLTVRTEMDLRLQRTAEAVLRRKLPELREAIAEDDLAAIEQLSGAIVTVDTRNGGVRALVGGPDFARQQVNAATSRNQPGSAMKPFGLAGLVDEGQDPRTTSFPAPADISLDFEGQEYEVSNFGGRDHGRQTVHEATLTSTNTVYVQIAKEIGPEKVVEVARDAGIDSDLQPNPSLILGTDVVTPLEMAEAYATFAAGGVHADARFVVEVTDEDGDVIFRQEPDSDGVLDSNVAYVVSDILADNIESGTGTRADIGRPAAGKTGTTQNSADAWFVGYVPQLSTAVWFGDLAGDNPMGDITGGSIPAETWGEYMAEAVKNLKPEDFPEPDYGALEGEDVETAPSPTPTDTGSPSPSPTDCPSDLLPVEEGGPCPSPTGSPSPTDSPTGTASPTPTETGPTEEPSPSEEPSPTETTPTVEPTETAPGGSTGGGTGGDGGGGADGGGVGGDGGGEPAPAPS